MEFEWHVRAACGYAELGMFRESIAELDAIPPRQQNRPEVLQVRLHHLMRTKRWGPVALLKEPIYYYNMGCYEALLGNMHGAKENLHISFKMDASFREVAKKDPDLQALHALI